MKYNIDIRIYKENSNNKNSVLFETIEDINKKEFINKSKEYINKVFDNNKIIKEGEKKIIFEQNNIKYIAKLIAYDFEPCAELCLSNWGGVAIEIDKSGEKVRYKYYDNEVSRWQNIKYTRKGEPYFMINNIRYKLNEFIRTNL